MAIPAKSLPRQDLHHILVHTGRLWESARGKTFFITGGTGFFGMWLLESFFYINDALGLNMRAAVLTRDKKSFKRKAPALVGRQDLEFIDGDVRSFPFPEGPFDFAIHAATEASAKLDQENPNEMSDAIVEGTRHVLEFVQKTGVKKVLFTSSGAVYGPQPSALSHLPEDYLSGVDASNLNSAYARGKHQAEQMCIAGGIAHGYEVKIARCFAFVGPHLPLDSHFAIGNFIGNVLNQEGICVAGNGTPRRSYLYASDLAIWLWTILFSGPTGRPYNVGSDKDISIAELAEMVGRESNPPLPVKILRPTDIPSPVQRYVPSIERAKNELKLEVRIPLKHAISKTINWLSATPGDI